MNMEAEDCDILEPHNWLYGYEPDYSMTPYSII